MKLKQHNPRHIYFIKVHDLVKIGITININSILYRIRTDCPYESELIRSIENCFIEHEVWLHNKFIHLHIKGEWFKFHEEMLFIKFPENLPEIQNKLIIKSRSYSTKEYQMRKELADSIVSEVIAFHIPFV